MIVKEFNDIIEIRPGRKIFVRHWISNPLVDPSTPPQRTIHLVCVHGTAASQEQYLMLWKELDLQLHDDKTTTATTTTLRIHLWAYDAIGCGHSPKISGNPAAYVDQEQVQDLAALMENHVFAADSSREIYFVGHSYGPTWIYKYLKHQKEHSTKGLILLSTGLECKELATGGPGIFKILPLWLLKCLQPMLTNSFLQIGFAPATHRDHPELIAQAKIDNNQNDMEVCLYYYKAHDWLSDLTTIDTSYLPSSVLVMHGTEDQVVPIHCGQNVANQLKTPLVSINDASHMILLEKPEEVARHMISFLTTPPNLLHAMDLTCQGKAHRVTSINEFG